MMRKEVDVFSEASDFAVVRMPGRQFPGCVIQGDSLCILLHRVQDVHQRVEAAGDKELAELTAELVETISVRLDHYESALLEDGIQIPYSR